jgi:hypothetical protein
LVRRAGELAIHRFLSAPSVSCREMLATLAGSTLAATARRHVVVAQDTIQLVDARNGSARPATDVIDGALLSVAEAIGPTLEGNTERQKNPHPPHSLGWLAWIIARLGGWNCYYKTTRPQDNESWVGKFETMAAGFAVAMTLKLKSNPRIP